MYGYQAILGLLFLQTLIHFLIDREKFVDWFIEYQGFQYVPSTSQSIRVLANMQVWDDCEFLLRSTEDWPALGIPSTWIDQLHFFDSQHSFRKKLWTSTYLGLESYHPTSECCWRGEFVKMKIWNLQPLLVCSDNSLKNLPHWGWLKFLAGSPDWHLWSWTGVWLLTHPSMWWVNVFWYIRTPWIRLLRIRCWRRRCWICKNVSRYTMRVPNTWRPILCGSAFPENGLAFHQESGWGGKNTGWLATWE